MFAEGRSWQASDMMLAMNGKSRPLAAAQLNR
jgi:hypothetical protein